VAARLHSGRWLDALFWLRLRPEGALLDNMMPEQLREAVAMVRGRAITETSGRITLETAEPIAASGVDLISIGWLTYGVTALDIGLDYQTASQTRTQTVRLTMGSALRTAAAAHRSRPVA